MIDLELKSTGTEFAKVLSELKSESETMRRVVKQGGYEDDRASLNLLDDEAMVEQVLKAAKPYQDANAVVLVGMGGPGLGAKAVQEAFTGVLHNAHHSPSVFYADTVDPVRTDAILQTAEIYLKAEKKLVVIVATQSGGTTETIAGAALFHQLFTTYGVDPVDHMPLVTNKGSTLDTWGKDHGFTRVLVPRKVGGRFSVFSPIGLFPLAVLGLDIAALVAGSKEFRDAALAGSIEGNAAALSAAAIAQHYRAGRNIHVTFLFAPELESLGLWCRQIMAESLGKATDRDGERVNVGITPTIAIGSRDLHSMLQLYMDGPDDKFTTFVRIQNTNDQTVPGTTPFTALVDHLAGQSLQAVTDAIADGVVHAYHERSRPYTVVKLPEVSAETLGAFLQFKMMETMYLGALLNVNPFDQPGVEAYKIETKRLLATS